MHSAEHQLFATTHYTTTFPLLEGLSPSFIHAFPLAFALVIDSLPLCLKLQKSHFI